MQNPLLFLALGFGLIIATGLIAVLVNDWLEGVLGRRGQPRQVRPVALVKRRARPRQLPVGSLTPMAPKAAAEGRLGWRAGRDSVWEPVGHAERSTRSEKRVAAGGGLPGR